MEFNKLVHETNEHGDPLRTKEGEYSIKSNWKKSARDHMGRAFNSKLHGEEPELDDLGNLKMRRRDAARKPMTATNRTEEFVSKYRQNGYAYRLINDDPGRLAQFLRHDWEVVSDDQGQATMSMGQGRQPATRGILVRKPQEWYDEDQKQKDVLLNANLENATKPKTAEGQYGEGLKTSPLR